MQLGKLDKPMFQSWMEILLLTRETYLWLIRRPQEAGKMCFQCSISWHSELLWQEKSSVLLASYRSSPCRIHTLISTCFSLDRATHYAGGKEAQCFISAEQNCVHRKTTKRGGKE